MSTHTDPCCSVVQRRWLRRGAPDTQRWSLRSDRLGNQHGQRGAVALEFLLIISMLIVVFLVMLQYAVRAHAQRIATAAAEEGLASAAAYDGSPAAGEQAARRYLDDPGLGLHGATVTASRSAATATVTVSGKVDQLVPFLPVTVLVHVEAPVERFVAETGAAP